MVRALWAHLDPLIPAKPLQGTNSEMRRVETSGVRGFSAEELANELGALVREAIQNRQSLEEEQRGSKPRGHFVPRAQHALQGRVSVGTVKTTRSSQLCPPTFLSPRTCVCFSSAICGVRPQAIPSFLDSVALFLSHTSLT